MRKRTRTTHRSRRAKKSLRAMLKFAVRPSAVYEAPNLLLGNSDRVFAWSGHGREAGANDISRLA